MVIAKRSLRDRLRHWVLPAGADSAARVLLISRSLRGLCDGYVAVMLPAYLLALGLGKLDVGLVSTATLIGSSVATIAVGALAHRFAARRMF
ncbi:MAG: MFS transporter, partial [Trinickia sp.]